MVGRIHSIETLGTVDGPGIRYVVFMQGCPLRCRYCHNPDTWDLNGGTSITVREIFEDYERYSPYLKNGGLTLTGGEPLLQMDFVLETFREAKERGIHTCLDTSGIIMEKEERIKREKLDLLAKLTDLVLLDIKHIQDDRHKTLTGRSNKEVLEFARFLDEQDVDMWIRHVVVPGITDYEEDLEKLGMFIGSLKHMKALDVLPYHNMGKVKYKAMGLDYSLDGAHDLTKEEAIKAKQIIVRGFQKGRKTIC